jgi:hypothetical protein
MESQELIKENLLRQESAQVAVTVNLSIQTYRNALKVCKLLKMETSTFFNEAIENEVEHQLDAEAEKNDSTSDY